MHGQVSRARTTILLMLAAILATPSGSTESRSGQRLIEALWKRDTVSVMLLLDEAERDPTSLRPSDLVLTLRRAPSKAVGLTTLRLLAKHPAPEAFMALGDHMLERRPGWSVIQQEQAGYAARAEAAATKRREQLDQWTARVANSRGRGPTQDAVEALTKVQSPSTVDVLRWLVRDRSEFVSAPARKGLRKWLGRITDDALTLAASELQARHVRSGDTTPWSSYEQRWLIPAWRQALDPVSLPLEAFDDPISLAQYFLDAQATQVPWLTPAERKAARADLLARREKAREEEMARRKASLRRLPKYPGEEEPAAEGTEPAADGATQLASAKPAAAEVCLPRYNPRQGQCPFNCQVYREPGACIGPREDRCDCNP